MAKSNWDATNIPDQKDRVVIITGATSGLGKEAARVLAVGGTIIYSDFHPFGALSGWQRAFTAADGTVYHLEHHIHLYSDHLRACQKAGLSIDVVLEPVGGEIAPAGFENMPMVLVIRAVKTNDEVRTVN